MGESEDGWLRIEVQVVDDAIRILPSRGEAFQIYIHDVSILSPLVAVHDDVWWPPPVPRYVGSYKTNPITASPHS